jgi:hypothetical protein
MIILDRGRGRVAEITRNRDLSFEKKSKDWIYFSWQKPLQYHLKKKPAQENNTSSHCEPLVERRHIRQMGHKLLVLRRISHTPVI